MAFLSVARIKNAFALQKLNLLAATLVSFSIVACTAPTQDQLGELIGNPTVIVTTPTPSATATPTPTPTSGGLQIVAGNAQTVGVGSTASSELTVRAVDDNGSPVSGIPVTFAVSGTGSVNAVIDTTDGDGLASVSYTAGGTAGAVTVSASSSLGSAEFDITVVALTSFTIQKVSGNAQSGSVNGSLGTALTVLVLDSNNLPAPNTLVLFTVESNNGTIGGNATSLQTTNASGFAQVNFTLGTASGANSVKAALLAAPAIYTTFSATGTVPSNSTVDLSESTISLSSNTAQANNTTLITVTVRVKDQYGNLIPNSGQTIATTFSPGIGTWQTNSTFAYTSAGTYTNTYKVGSTAGTEVFSTTINAAALASGSASLVITAGNSNSAGGASLTVVSGNSQSLQIGQTAASPLKVIALDSLGLPVANSSVTFTVSGGTGSGTVEGAASTAVNTASDGTAEVDFVGTTAGTVTVSVSSLQGTAAFSLTVQDLTGYAVNKVNAGTTNNQTAIINTALTNNMKVQVLNGSNQPVASTQVRFQCQSANCGTFSNGTDAITITTDATGYAEAAYTLGTASGTYTVRAILPQQASIYTDYTHTATVSGSATVSAAQTTVGLSSSSLQANGLNQTTVTVTLKDQYGNTIPTCSKTVTASFSPSTGSWQGGGFSCSSSSGVYTRTYQVGTSGTSEVVTATVDAVTMTNTATLTLLANSYDATVSDVTRSSATLTANNTDTSILTFSLKDAYGNLVYDADHLVQFVATPSSSLGTLVGSVTNVGNGTYTQVFKAGTVSNAGSVSIQAQIKDNGAGSWTNIGSAVTIAFQPGAVSLGNSTFTATKMAIPASGTTSIVVTARDAYSNPITSGLTVAITQATGTGSLASLVNNGDGTYSRTYTAPASTGSSTFTATINGSAVGSTLTIVIQNYAGTSITCANYGTACNGGSCAGADLYVENGTLTITNRTNNTTASPDCTMSFGSLTVGSGGIVTHTQSTTSNVYGMDFTVTGALTVNAGGSIDVDGKGYNVGSTRNPGYTNGNTTTGGASGASSAGPGYAATGGSYGGIGGSGILFSNHPNSMYSARSSNATYGSASNPVHPGSGGGGGWNTSVTGNGGGVIRITAGSIVNNGTISANGANGTPDNNGICSGSGSGGGIYLSLSGSGTLAGSGTIRANGGTTTGRGCTYNIYNAISEGGGGRVAIIGDDSSWPLSQIQVRKGITGMRSSTGGTIYRSLGAYTSAQTLNTDLSVENSSDTTNIFGSTGSYTLSSNYVVTLHKAITVNNLTVQSGAYISAPFATVGSAINGIDITAAGTITVDSGGYIFADYRGYPPGYTLGNTTTGASIAANYSWAVNVNVPGGGSFGGRGNNSRFANARYGTATDVTYPGSGGGSTTQGGAGGGMIILSVANLVNNGIITANGADVQNTQGALNANINAGAGSGGSIKVVATGTMTGSGTFRANGGQGDAASMQNIPGFGGGGRIYLGGDSSAIALSQLEVKAPGLQSYLGHTHGGGTPGTIYRTLGAYSGSQTLSGDLWVEADGSGNATGSNVINSTTNLTVASGATLMTDGNLTLNNLTVNGVVTHSHPYVTSATPRVNLTITNALTVASGGAIDVSGRGFQGILASVMSNTNSNVAYSNGYSSVPAGPCINNQGGSHYTAGGCKSASLSTWGSLTDPNTYGGAGSNSAWPTTKDSHSGGGIVRIEAASMNISGAIRANAGSHSIPNGADGGAGGSIKLSAPAMTIGASATVSANGSIPGTWSASYGCSGTGGIIYIKRTIASSSIEITPSNVKGSVNYTNCTPAAVDGPAVTYDTY